MDPRFAVEDRPRQECGGVSAETPLVTVAWRAMRQEHQRRAEQRRKEQVELRQLLSALADVAEQAHRLRSAAGSDFADRLLETLERAGVTILSPVGQPYAGYLVELFENIAQRPQPGITEPIVAEVIAPAIAAGAISPRPRKSSSRWWIGTKAPVSLSCGFAGAAAVGVMARPDRWYGAHLPVVLAVTPPAFSWK